MTQRHHRYLMQYPMRIHRKRLKRRRVAGKRTQYKSMAVGRMRKVLAEYMASRPQQQPIRAGNRNWWTRVKETFRKPAV